MRDFVDFIRVFVFGMILYIFFAFGCLLFCSCFVTGREIRIVTPKMEITADTATAITWPYNTKFQ